MDNKKKIRVMKYLLENARRILDKLPLNDDQYAEALNRIYAHYTGDDIFDIIGLESYCNYAHAHIKKRPKSEEHRSVSTDETLSMF